MNEVHHVQIKLTNRKWQSFIRRVMIIGATFLLLATIFQFLAWLVLPELGLFDLRLAMIGAAIVTWGIEYDWLPAYMLVSHKQAETAADCLPRWVFTYDTEVDQWVSTGAKWRTDLRHDFIKLQKNADFVRVSGPLGRLKHLRKILREFDQ